MGRKLVFAGADTDRSLPRLKAAWPRLHGVDFVALLVAHFVLMTPSYVLQLMAR